MLKSFMLATFVLLAASGIYAGSVSSTVSLSEAEASKLMGADLPNIGSCQGSKTCDQCVAGNCYEDGFTGMCWGFYWWYGSSEVAHPYCEIWWYGICGGCTCGNNVNPTCDPGLPCAAGYCDETTIASLFCQC
jgi:hypothetical protein